MPGFSSPPDPNLYKNLVWNIVRQIPSGKVATYGQVAGLAGSPPGADPANYQAFGARWVGSAMAACPDNVPWQRVVNSAGKISLPMDKGGSHQLQLLEDEGIIFDERDRINLNIFRWEGPASDQGIENYEF